MVTTTTNRMGRQITDTMLDLDMDTFKTVGVVAGLGSVGAVLASMGAERLLEFAGRTTSPSTARQYATRGFAKLLVAVAPVLLSGFVLGERNYWVGLLSVMSLVAVGVAGGDFLAALRRTRLGNQFSSPTSRSAKRISRGTPSRSPSRPTPNQAATSTGRVQGRQTEIDAGTEEHRSWA